MPQPECYKHTQTTIDAGIVTTGNKCKINTHQQWQCWAGNAAILNTDTEPTPALLHTTCLHSLMCPKRTLLPTISCSSKSTEHMCAPLQHSTNKHNPQCQHSKDKVFNTNTQQTQLPAVRGCSPQVIVPHLVSMPQMPLPQMAQQAG